MTRCAAKAKSHLLRHEIARNAWKLVNMIDQSYARHLALSGVGGDKQEKQCSNGAQVKNSAEDTKIFMAFEFLNDQP